MRYPRASAVVVALSTFVAVVTVATLVSQLAPLDRAGAVLPDGPIVTTAQPVDESPVDEVDESPVDETATATEAAASATDAPTAADAVSTDDGTTVVVPVPAQTVAPDPEPSTPTTPGNSGNAPGQPESPGNSGSAPGQSKP